MTEVISVLILGAILLAVVVRIIVMRPKPEYPIVEQISALHLEAGDTLVLKSDRAYSAAQMARIRADLLPRLPADVKLLILDRGLELEVIRPEPNVLGVAEPHVDVPLPRAEGK